MSCSLQLSPPSAANERCHLPFQITGYPAAPRTSARFVIVVGSGLLNVTVTPFSSGYVLVMNDARLGEHSHAAVIAFVNVIPLFISFCQRRQMLRDPIGGPVLRIARLVADEDDDVRIGERSVGRRNRARHNDGVTGRR